MKGFLIRIAWFLLPACLGVGLMLLDSRVDLRDPNITVFTVPFVYTSLATLLGGIIFYAAFILNIGYIVWVWIDSLKK